jgi:hypothetical protein
MTRLMKIQIACLLLHAASFAQDDVLVRAQRAAYIPNLRVHYSVDQDRAQVIWASLAWDFDECFGPGNALAALQIKRLERERQTLTLNIEDLDMDGLPSLD